MARTFAVILVSLIALATRGLGSGRCGREQRAQREHVLLLTFEGVLKLAVDTADHLSSL